MFCPVKICLKELNPLITCSICQGYLIDATSLVDCHHSFCRSCITKHVLASNVCPVCGLLIHKTKPELNLVADKNLQQIVYKLVPGLLRDEIKKRDEFYSQNENVEKGVNDSISESDYSDIAERDQTKVCIHIKIIKTLRTSGGKLALINKSKKYLFCPGLFTVRLLKKFVHDKCELEEVDNVEIIHSSDDEFIPDHYTLLDVAQVYNWRADSPLELKCILWSDCDFSTENPNADMSNAEKASHLISSEYPFQSFKEFCKHVRKAKICPFISPKKRHKRLKNKHGFRDVTNVHHHSKERKDFEENGTCSGTSTNEVECLNDAVAPNSSISQEGCKLKLRIRTKGIKDSVLVLSSDQASSSDAHVNENAKTNCDFLVQNKPYFSVDQMIDENNDRSIKKFMSKKDILFSRLSLDKVDSPMICKSIPKSNAEDNATDQPVLCHSKDPLAPNYCSEKEPLTISIEEGNKLISTGNTSSYNYKKKLLLATVPTRAKGQLWTPYKSPLKEVSQDGMERTSSAASERSKSPVIIFNPSLPLPSFTSLLQSFGSKSVGSDNGVDHSLAGTNNSNLNSKIGVFISKGKSMTLEQKTKLVSDGTPQEETNNVDVNEHLPEKSENVSSYKNIVVPEEAEGSNDSEEFVRVRDKERVQKNKPNVTRNNFGRSKQKTPPWLGKRIQLKKCVHGTLSDDGKLVNNDYLKSPQRKKPMLDGDIKNENRSCSDKNPDDTKELLPSKIYNISKRALKILN